MWCVWSVECGGVWSVVVCCGGGVWSVKCGVCNG